MKENPSKESFCKPEVGWMDVFWTMKTLISRLKSQIINSERLIKVSSKAVYILSRFNNKYVDNAVINTCMFSIHNSHMHLMKTQRASLPIHLRLLQGR